MFWRKIGIIRRFGGGEMLSIMRIWFHKDIKDLKDEKRIFPVQSSYAVLSLYPFLSYMYHT